MKKIMAVFCCIYLFSGCFVLRKKVTYGCPSDGRNIGAEKLLSENPKAQKSSKIAKYKGGNKVYE